MRKWGIGGNDKNELIVANLLDRGVYLMLTGFDERQRD
jgi:hypothetical protein